jgi:putative chitinase
MSLKDFQIKIGTVADGSFGPGTLKAAQAYYKLSDNRIIHIMAQTGHETGDFRLFIENLNYSSDGLLRIFKKYFPNKTTADKYARQPEKIANKVYAGRMGNGNEASGDGWKFRGRGFLQNTGRSNYQLLANHLNDQSIMINPDLVATKYAFEAAMFYFDTNKLWEICDLGVSDDVVKKVTQKVNGGQNGIVDRISKTRLYAKWLV